MLRITKRAVLADWSTEVLRFDFVARIVASLVQV